jgi:hypothetical protein
MINLLPLAGSTFALENGVLGIISLLIPPLLCIVCLHELYAKYKARHFPPGMSGLLCFFLLPKDKDKPWLRILEVTQKYGMPIHVHERLSTQLNTTYFIG